MEFGVYYLLRGESYCVLWEKNLVIVGVFLLEFGFCVYLCNFSFIIWILVHCGFVVKQVRCICV